MSTVWITCLLQWAQTLLELGLNPSKAIEVWHKKNNNAILVPIGVSSFCFFLVTIIVSDHPNNDLKQTSKYYTHISRKKQSKKSVFGQVKSFSIDMLSNVMTSFLCLKTLNWGWLEHWEVSRGLEGGTSIIRSRLTIFWFLKKRTPGPTLSVLDKYLISTYLKCANSMWLEWIVK